VRCDLSRSSNLENTDMLLLYIVVRELLDTLGTPYDINSKGSSVKSNKENGRRINYLAEARNLAMQPFYSGAAAQHMPGGKFHEVLFMNDVYHCASDILEVMLQKRTQGANQACATDWGGRVVYDRWIIRTMSGR
jgi:alpha-1,3-mannosyltransferase